ncbi:hypothetical protein BIY26_13280 [Brenneria goodwinii]|uniref:Uncharacterized protein n=1 Tax=Brenneria goodwinii TaxID=1109412 RepID=A0AAE8JMY0_9GAMM|nr:hypothetical protein [Brenneria goodwinii]ATA27067.1 hypothetical protein AWC36_17565 [Brenneria goodwinii]RLM22427.1 hypothetical protein BIY26_13280 [Brenneria goodwinii]
MDTVEQRNGSYFFDGMMNLTQGELAFWIVVDEAQNQLGVKDVFSLALIIGGIPIIPTRTKLDALRTTKNTSPLSVAMRSLIRHRLETRWRSPTWRTMLNGQWAKTNSLGGLIGRWLPWVGVIITAYDLAMITLNSVRRFNLIVKPEHRV